MGIGRVIVILLIGLFCWLPLPAQAASYMQNYAPPLSFSNADLVGQDFSGQMLRAAELSNANLEGVNFTDANLEGAVLSASVMTKTNLHGANLTNALVDQVKFVETDLSDAVLNEAILLRSTFEAIKIAGADFTDAILDGFQVKLLCQQASGVNSKTGISTRDSLGCR